MVNIETRIHWIQKWIWSEKDIPLSPKSLDKKKIDAQVMNDMGRWLVFKDKCDLSLFTRQGEADSK